MLYSIDEIKVPNFFVFHVSPTVHLLQICHRVLPSGLRSPHEDHAPCCSAVQTGAVSTAATCMPIAYQLVIEVTRPVRITVGSLGLCAFPAGRYVYTGSAMRNPEARIARHLARAKTLRWHIDYLLNAPGVRIVDVLRFEEPECAVNRGTAGEIVVPRFGASDCRAGCGSHLKRL